MFSPVRDARIQEERPQETQFETQMEQALRLLPAEDRAAYDQAMAANAALVARESPADRFLRFCDHDPWRAASKLVYYWECRLEVFGERAFLPLDETGEGALDARDLEVVRAGAHVVLPNDPQGRAVVCSSRVGIEKDYGDIAEIGMNRLRAAFYAFSKASENPKTQTRGLRWIVSLDMTSTTNDRVLLSKARRLVLDAIPIRFASADMIVQHAASHTRVIPPIVSYLAAQWSNLPFVIHTCEDKSKLLHSLESLGFQKHGIPKELVGDWSGELDVTAVTKEEEARKKREKAAEYGRRKRARRKVEHEVLALQVQTLQVLQSNLRERQAQLEDLVAQARHMVHELDKLQSTNNTIQNLALESILPNLFHDFHSQPPVIGPDPRLEALQRIFQHSA